VREVPSVTGNPFSRGEDSKLERRAQELETLRQAEHDSAFSGDQREVTGEASVVGQHPADVADFTYQRELQYTTQEILDREAQQVRDALRRRQEGRYGICASCGQPIGAERLEARPEATLCIDCQRRLEGSRPG
jgi:RNA polymerase-binding protein DksA